METATLISLHPKNKRLEKKTLLLDFYVYRDGEYLNKLKSRFLLFFVQKIHLPE